jgi:hypothetical protein
LQAGELRTEDDPRVASPKIISKKTYERATPKDSIFWKVDSDGNEWRKDSYGTIWKKSSGLDPGDPASWDIDGFDFRQAHRIGMDTLVQFQLNLDGTLKPDSVRKTTWIAPVDAEPTTLPIYMQNATLQSIPLPGAASSTTRAGSSPALQKERPKLIPDQIPKSR